MGGSGKRDFTEATVALIENNLDNDADSFWDFGQDMWAGVGAFFASLSLNEDMNNLEKYLEKLCEYEDITRTKLDNILYAVRSVEEDYARRFTAAADSMNNYKMLVDTYLGYLANPTFNAQDTNIGNLASPAFSLDAMREATAPLAQAANHFFPYTLTENDMENLLASRGTEEYYVLDSGGAIIYDGQIYEIEVPVYGEGPAFMPPCTPPFHTSSIELPGFDFGRGITYLNFSDHRGKPLWGSGEVVWSGYHPSIPIADIVLNVGLFVLNSKTSSELNFAFTRNPDGSRSVAISASSTRARDIYSGIPEHMFDRPVNTMDNLKPGQHWPYTANMRNGYEAITGNPAQPGARYDINYQLSSQRATNSTFAYVGIDNKGEYIFYPTYYPGEYIHFTAPVSSAHPNGIVADLSYILNRPYTMPEEYTRLINEEMPSMGR